MKWISNDILFLFLLYVGGPFILVGLTSLFITGINIGNDPLSLLMFAIAAIVVTSLIIIHHRKKK